MREIPSADIDFYQENGYIRYTDFFSNDEVQSLADAIDHAIISERERILGANNGGRGSDRYERVFNQMVNMWYDYPQVKSFAFNHQLAETARNCPKVIVGQPCSHLSRPCPCQTSGSKQSGNQLALGRALLDDGSGWFIVGLGGLGQGDGE